jgi:hypothetical protein
MVEGPGEWRARQRGYQLEIIEGATAESVIARHGLADDPVMVAILRSTERLRRVGLLY